jgi:mannan polymerase II complex ANP1 subunit
MIRNVVLSIVFFLGFVQFLTGHASGQKILKYYGNFYMHNTVEYYDFNDYQGSANGKDKGQRLLMCIPLRNAAPVLPLMFSHLENLTYPHHLIDIAFMVSDTTDNTKDGLYTHLERIQGQSKDAFNEIMIFEKDFGQLVGQGVDDRHGVHVQGIRRKVMGRARNWLLSAALRPYHTWVYWRDADIETAPATIIEDLMKHDQDVIVPNVWRPLPEWLGGEQPYDLNSWQETEPALELAKTLDEDEVIVEGYAEYPTWRPHLAYLRTPEGNPDDLLELDGIGGVSILARAKVFRHGANFPGFALWNHAETEGFGKMCRRMGFRVAGLIHYTVWHQYEPSEDDLKKIKEMEELERLKALGNGNNNN